MFFHYFLRLSILSVYLLLIYPLYEKTTWAKTIWLPTRDDLFPGLVADPWENQLEIVPITGYRQIGKIGSIVPLVKKTFEKSNTYLQLNIDLLTINMMRYRKEQGGGFDLDSTDTKFGLHTHFRSPTWQGRLGLHHYSSHLSDGLLWPTQKRAKQHYSREFLQLNISYPLPYIIPQAGIYYVFPQRHPKEYEGKSFFSFQWGGELFYPLSKTFAPFLAADWHAKEEYDFSINQSYVVGLRIQSASIEQFRVVFEYYTGFDPRGEFYNAKTSYQGIGLKYLF